MIKKIISYIVALCVLFNILVTTANLTVFSAMREVNFALTATAKSIDNEYINPNDKNPNKPIHTGEAWGWSWDTGVDSGNHIADRAYPWWEMDLGDKKSLDLLKVNLNDSGAKEVYSNIKISASNEDNVATRFKEGDTTEVTLHAMDALSDNLSNPWIEIDMKAKPTFRYFRIRKTAECSKLTTPEWQGWLEVKKVEAIKSLDLPEIPGNYCNVSTGKTAVAFDDYDGNVASNILDGDVATYWERGWNAVDSYIDIDLQDAYKIQFLEAYAPNTTYTDHKRGMIMLATNSFDDDRFTNPSKHSKIVDFGNDIQNYSSPWIVALNNEEFFRYIRIVKTEALKGEGFAIAEIKLYAPPEEGLSDVALNKKCTALDNSDNAGKATDGNPETGWTWGWTAQPAWVQVDLGEAYWIKGVEIKNHWVDSIHSRQNFKIVASNDKNFADGSEIFEIGRQGGTDYGWDNGNGRYKKSTSSPKDYRYIRVEKTYIDPDNDWGSETDLVVSDLKVFAKSRVEIVKNHLNNGEYTIHLKNNSGSLMTYEVYLVGLNSNNYGENIQKSDIVLAPMSENSLTLKLTNANRYLAFVENNGEIFSTPLVSSEYVGDGVKNDEFSVFHNLDSLVTTLSGKVVGGQKLLVSVKNSEGVFITGDYITCDIDGYFDYKFTMPSNLSGGKYTVTVGGLQWEFDYYDANDKQGIIGEFNKEDADISALLTTYIDNGLLKVDKNDITLPNFALEFKNVAKESGSFNTINDITVNYGKTALKISTNVAMSYEEIKLVIEKYQSIILPIAKDSMELMIDSICQKIYQGKPYNTYSSFEQNARNLILLLAPEKLDTIKFQVFVEANNRYYEFDLTNKYYLDNPSNVLKVMRGKTYTRLLDIQSDYINRIIMLSKPQGGGGGGGGGGSRPVVSIDKDEMKITGEISVLPSDIEVEFSDLDGVEWAIEDIKYLHKKGVINGTTDETFSPLENIKKEEFAKMIVLTFEIEIVDNVAIFNDVNQEQWYAKYVNSLYVAKVVEGDGEGYFGIGEYITREDMATIIARVLTVTTLEHADKFADDNLISDYAKNAVYSMKNEGIIDGYEDDTFRPKSLATRAETCKMLKKAMDRMVAK